ncbi:enoyl-CoA hydratase/isomerase [Iodidimonas sp. SYSU 1G8]|uniref:enoyl-CoA hydratase/isomerase n=1 Tax=Iodidimonas sp. SYSU 1G8 TaxID=3133967 RepID=UPI0031FECB96
MKNGKVKLDIADNIAVLTLNDPVALNAVSMGVLEDLIEALTVIEDKNSGVRCLIFTGEGRGFCAGANLGGGISKEPGSSDSDAGDVLERFYHPILKRLRDLPFPMITAVNGVAAGVGMSFALMGDMILAARSAYFLQAFRRIGLVPDGGSTYLLPRLVGLARAKELSLMAEKLPAEKALEWGLINRVYDDAALMDEARKLASELANGPTVALGLIRKLYWNSPLNTYDDQLDLERQSQKIAGRTEDFGEGVKAFFDKRPAQFRGK